MGPTMIFFEKMEGGVQFYSQALGLGRGWERGGASAVWEAGPSPVPRFPFSGRTTARKQRQHQILTNSHFTQLAGHESRLLSPIE